MPTAGNPPGPVILFTHEGFSYEYRESLGVGPHGESLLLARKRSADNILEDVIVKCVALPPGEPGADTLRARARLEEEARLAAYLKHRCLVRVLGHQQVGDTLYTALEHVRGPTLNELLGLTLERGKPFSEALTLYVGAEVASALAHVHTRADEHDHPLGIVHRNLDTDTVRLTWRGAVKLADFGRALSQLPGRLDTTLRRPRGPLFFTAPETLLDEKVDARSDLFAVGLVLLEFATGRHLFDPPTKTLDDMRALLPARQHRRVERAVRAAVKAGHEDVAEQVLWSAATFTSADVEEAAAPLSPALKSILARLLRREPSERFQTAVELEATLRARLEALGPYDGRAAIAEIKKALTEAGEALVSQELVPGLLSPNPTGPHLPGQISTR